jgi:hypothetical protein
MSVLNRPLPPGPELALLFHSHGSWSGSAARQIKHLAECTSPPWLAFGTELIQLFRTMNLHDTQGRRLYLTADERRAFIRSAPTAARPVRTLCMVLHDTGYRISEALALTSESVDLSGMAMMFESLKKRRRVSTGPCRCRPPSSAPSTWSMAFGRLRNAAEDNPTICSGPGHATPRGGTSKP